MQPAYHCVTFPYQNDTMVQHFKENHKYVTVITLIFIHLFQTSYISREMRGKIVEKEYVKIK